MFSNWFQSIEKPIQGVKRKACYNIHPAGKNMHKFGVLLKFSFVTRGKDIKFISIKLTQYSNCWKKYSFGFLKIKHIKDVILCVLREEKCP